MDIDYEESIVQKKPKDPNFDVQEKIKELMKMSSPSGSNASSQKFSKKPYKSRKSTDDINRGVAHKIKRPKIKQEKEKYKPRNHTNKKEIKLPQRLPANRSPLKLDKKKRRHILSSPGCSLLDSPSSQEDYSSLDEDSPSARHKFFKSRSKAAAMVKINEKIKLSSINGEVVLTANRSAFEKKNIGRCIEIELEKQIASASLNSPDNSARLEMSGQLGSVTSRSTPAKPTRFLSPSPKKKETSFHTLNKILERRTSPRKQFLKASCSPTKLKSPKRTPKKLIRGGLDSPKLLESTLQKKASSPTLSKSPKRTPKRLLMDGISSPILSKSPRRSPTECRNERINTSTMSKNSGHSHIAKSSQELEEKGAKGQKELKQRSPNKKWKNLSKAFASGEFDGIEKSLRNGLERVNLKSGAEDAMNGSINGMMNSVEKLKFNRTDGVKNLTCNNLKNGEIKADVNRTRITNIASNVGTNMLENEDLEDFDLIFDPLEVKSTDDEILSSLIKENQSPEKTVDLPLKRRSPRKHSNKPIVEGEVTTISSSSGVGKTPEERTSTPIITQENERDSSAPESQVRYFPIFEPKNRRKIALNASKFSSVLASGNKEKKRFLMKKNDPLQLIIDAGQKDFGAKFCRECGTLFEVGNPEDEKNHSIVHSNISFALKFKGWKNEDQVTYIDGIGGRIVQVSPKDNVQWWHKVHKVLKVVDDELGFSESGIRNRGDTKAYLYILDKSVVGVLIAEAIDKAYKVIQEDISSPSGGENTRSEAKGMDPVKETKNKLVCCSKEPERVSFGISRIWVSNLYRRKGIASKLVDAMRANMIGYTHYLSVEDFAFSDPTENGLKFAENYIGRSNFLVYRRE